MTASPEAIALVCAGVAAAVYAFSCEHNQDRIARGVKKWVLEARPDAWESLPRFGRSLLRSGIALKLLRRKGIVQDPAFHALCAPYDRLERRKLIAIGVVAFCVAIVWMGV
jgi:hypothetical protein